MNSLTPFKQTLWNRFQTIVPDPNARWRYFCLNCSYCSNGVSCGAPWWNKCVSGWCKGYVLHIFINLRRNEEDDTYVNYRLIWSRKRLVLSELTYAFGKVLKCMYVMPNKLSAHLKVDVQSWPNCFLVAPFIAELWCFKHDMLLRQEH